MSKVFKSFQKIDKAELLAQLSIFVGLPLSAYLYFDYKAAILVLSIVGTLVGILAVRNK